MRFLKMKNEGRSRIFLALVLVLIGNYCLSANVYWNPTAGNDSNNGLTAATAVKTFAKAKEKLAAQDANSWILMCSTYRLSGSETFDGKISGTRNVQIKRSEEFGDYMFLLSGASSGSTMTFQNITLSGEYAGAIPHPDKETRSVIIIGGGIKLHLKSGTVIKDNYLIDKTAGINTYYGGAVRLSSNSSVTIEEGCTISNCRANTYGGAIAGYPGVNFTIQMNGGTIKNCYAGRTESDGTVVGIGGAVVLGDRISNNSFVINKGTITGCSAGLAGGGIYIYGGEFSLNSGALISDCTVSGSNRDRQNGGGIYATDCTININGGTIIGCKANDYGGGVYASNTNINFSKGIIEECRCAGLSTTDNRGRGGAIAMRLGGLLKMNSSEAKVYNNYAQCYGGGVEVRNGVTFDFEDGIISNNRVGVEGETIISGAAGLHIASATFNMTGGEISNNFAYGLGGGIHSNNGLMVIYGGKIINNEAYVQGGGINLNTHGSLSFPASSTAVLSGNKSSRGGAVLMDCADLHIDAGTFQNNQALSNYEFNSYHIDDTKGCGGTFCIVIENASDITEDTRIANAYFHGGYMANNIAKKDGGFIYLNKDTGATPMGGSFNIYVYGGIFEGNTAGYEGFDGGNGGAIYSGKGTTFNMKSDPVTKNTARFYKNKAFGKGGAVYMEDATFTMTAGEFSTNFAKQGGGFYISGDNTQVVIKGGSIVENQADKDGGGFAILGNGIINISQEDVDTLTLIEGNSSNLRGGGFYAENGFSMASGYIQKNTAKQGGGVFVAGGNIYVSNGTIQKNEAEFGAGLYMMGHGEDNIVSANFSNGTFTENEASENGGGIYMGQYAVLNMSGSSNVTKNMARVHGGGIYKTGGKSSIIMVGGSSLMIDDNHFGSLTGRNDNLFLSGKDDFLTIDPISGISGNVLVGVSVDASLPHLFPKRVVYCEEADILDKIYQKMKKAYNGESKDDDSRIFDDAELYLPVFQSSPEPFTFDYIFFIQTWNSAVVTKPSGFALDNIDSPEDFCWFMKLANGKVSHMGTLDGVITANLDMSDYLWLPIGGYKPSGTSTTVPFTGSLTGNGHTISGIHTMGLIDYDYYGLFGETDNATISGLCLTDFEMVSDEGSRIGAIVGLMHGGSVTDCTVGGVIDASGSQEHSTATEGGCIIGGLVGETTGAAVLRNVISTSDIRAGFKQMEGYEADSRTVGGLVGKTSASTLVENGFSNAKILHGSWYPRYVGGLVGDNQGTMNNCYVRLERGVTLEDTPYSGSGYPSGPHSKFGMFAGNNGGAISYCYAPDATLYGNRTYVFSGSSASNYGDYAATVTPYRYGQFADGASDNLVDGGESLLAKLNSWVGDKECYSHWMRTSASPVNGDYPILSFDNLQNTLDYVAVVATRDNTELRYTTSANTAIAESNAYGDEVTVYLYRSPKEEVITTDNTSRVKIYIKEDVAILQGDGNTLQNAYVGVTMDNSAGAIDWHMFSSPLEGAPMGVDYDGDSNEYAPWFEAGTPSGMPEYAFYDDDVRDGYFPSSTPYASYDYYTYLEPQYHWINFKRNSNSHWHQDGAHDKIIYTNEDCLERGKGYLLAIGSETYMQSHGKLRGGDVVKTLSYTEGLGRDVIGYNLIGNPYQSYLDFDKFALENGVESYVVLDDDLGGYVSYAPTSSKNSYPSKDGEVPALNGCIHMHQGFFVRSWEPGKTVTFTNGMRQTTPKAESHLRGAQKDYPLVNLVSTEENGVSEYLTMEFGRPEKGGAEKMKSLRNGTSLLYTTIGDEDYSIAFMTQGTSTVPVRFETTEEGTFTMRWNTQNGAFTYLHLVDNKTGVDIDCLDSDEYRFTAAPDDYKSRFKLVVSYEDMEQEEMSTGEVFAFMMDGNLVVNGSGVLEVIDLQGRVMQTERLAGVQSVVSLPASAQGLYLLRMTGTEGTKVQKIVVR